MSAPNSSARGQATVELVVLVPIVLLVAAAAWQAVLAGHARWSASAAARAAARAHALGAEPVTAARRVLTDSLDDSVAVEETDAGVVVSLAIPTILPGLDLGTLTARAVFASQR